MSITDHIALARGGKPARARVRCLGLKIDVARKREVDSYVG